MHLKEALKHLKEGHSMYRTGWVPQDGYVVLMQGMTHVWKIVLQPAPNAGNYIFSFEDLLASDWEKFDLNKQPTVAEAELVDTEEKAA
jgi:hypothetical protein